MKFLVKDFLVNVNKSAENCGFYSHLLKKSLTKHLTFCAVGNCVLTVFTPQKMKFSIKDFFSKCDQIRRKLRIWSYLLKKSLMENFIFCAVFVDLTRKY